MKVYTVFAICLIGSLFTITTQQSTDATLNDDDNTNFDLAGNLANIVVNSVANKIQNLIELFDLKFRLIRFLRSLYTTDNLELIRKSLSLNVRFSNWVLSILPFTADADSSFLLRLLFPEINLDTSRSQDLSPDLTGASSNDVVTTDIDAPKTETPEIDGSLRNQIVSLNELILAGGQRNP